MYLEFDDDANGRVDRDEFRNNLWVMTRASPAERVDFSFAKLDVKRSIARARRMRHNRTLRVTPMRNVATPSPHPCRTPNTKPAHAQVDSARPPVAITRRLASPSCRRSTPRATWSAQTSRRASVGSSSSRGCSCLSSSSRSSGRPPPRKARMTSRLAASPPALPRRTRHGHRRSPRRRSRSRAASSTAWTRRSSAWSSSSSRRCARCHSPRALASPAVPRTSP